MIILSRFFHHPQTPYNVMELFISAYVLDPTKFIIIITKQVIEKSMELCGLAWRGVCGREREGTLRKTSFRLMKHSFTHLQFLILFTTKRYHDAEDLFGINVCSAMEGRRTVNGTFQV